MKASKGNYIVLFAVLLVAEIAGCAKDPAASLYVPTTSDVTATATLADLQQGRTLYINSCDRCHSLYLPENYSASQWKSILPGMTSRTSLTASEVQLLTEYVSKGQQLLSQVILH